MTAPAQPPFRHPRESLSVAMISTGRLRMHRRNIRRTFTRGPGVQDLELIAGHRRLAAAEIAGLTRVPVVVVPRHSDDEAILAMLAENTARVAVPAVDLGRAITALHDEFSYSFPAIAERLGITLDELQAWRQGRVAQTNAKPRRRQHAASNRPAPPPKLRPKALHELITRWDADEVDALELVAELRGWLGAWRPKPDPDQPVTS